MIVLSICVFLSVSFAAVCASAMLSYSSAVMRVALAQSYLTKMSYSLKHGLTRLLFLHFGRSKIHILYVVSTTRCIYTCPVCLECGPDLLLKCFERSDLYYKTHEVTRLNSPYSLYIFMFFFIKMKLSSRLCLTHKRVTQKYRNSILIKKKKSALGSDRNRRYSEFSGSDLKKMVSLHP